MDIAIMIEAQDGLTWLRWKNLVSAVEDLGFAGLYRSDHFTNAQPPDKDSLELWVSLTWLAAHTRRIEFGPLVTPFSFRHPALTARMASAVDDLSGGRLVLGVGAGWQEREHTMFAFDLLDLRARFDRFEEGLQVLTGLLRSSEPFSFAGRYYQLDEARLLPRPARPGGPRLLIGGNGEGRTLGMAARYADEWNAVFLPAGEFSRLNALLDEKLVTAGRQPGEVRRSMMTGLRFGSTEAEVERLLTARNQSREELSKRGVIIGTGELVKEQLSHLAAAGVQRVMLQWLDMDDLKGLARLAKSVLA